MTQHVTLLIALMQLDLPVPISTQLSLPNDTGHQLNDQKDQEASSATSQRTKEEISGTHSARISSGFPPKEIKIPRTSHDKENKREGSLSTVSKSNSCRQYLSRPIAESIVGKS